MVADHLRTICFALAILGVRLAAPASAEISTDGTVGPRVQLDGPEFAVGAELGTQAGHNLFHSFEKFSLGTGERATFSGPDDIRNVISRVTGGARSEIDGTLRSTIAGADFYFINPAGVLFGPNASLDVQGSFHVSTADELRFADGARFSATDPSASSLTVAAPEAFGFLGPSPAPILVDQSVLEVPLGEALSFVGGDITIVGGPEGFIGAEAGRITLAAVGGPGDMLLGSGAIDAVRKADISLTDLAQLDSSGSGGGTIQIRGSRFVMAGQSFLFAENDGASDAVGGIDVDADRVRLTGGSRLSTDVYGSGRGGTLRVRATDVRLSDDSQVGGAAFGPGDTGLVQVEADSLEIVRGGVITSATFSQGNAGGVTVEADRLSIRGGAANSFTGIASSAEAGSSGAAGSVTVRADRLLITRDGSVHFAGILSGSVPTSSGDAASVEITAGELEIRAGGAIISQALGAGHGGSVAIAADHLLMRGDGSDFVTGISSSASPGSSDDAGIVQITGGELEILAGAQITSATFSIGDAGSVTIAADRLSIRGDGSGIASSAERGSSGDAGTVQITAGELEILDGGGISSAAFSVGDAGRIRIQAATVEIADNGGISSSAFGSETAGDVILRAADRLVLDGASITTSSASGGGGQIQLLVGDVIDLRDSVIITSVGGGSDPTAGNILIDPTILIIDGSRIQANAPAGFGGQVRIVADNVLVPGGDFEGLLARGEISATGGDPTRDGTIVVNAPEVDLTAGLVVLEGNFIDETRLRARCGTRRDVGASSFTGVGRAGLPASPDGPLSSAYLGGIPPRADAGVAAPPSQPASFDRPAVASAPCLGAP